MSSVLLVGESWVIHETHFKGFDNLQMTSYSQGGQGFVDALTAAGHDVTWMRAEVATDSFPFDVSELADYDVIILSDIGANSLLLPPVVWRNARPRPNRLEVIRQFVEAGGGLLMCGGWRSFAGYAGGGFYHDTPVAEALPVGVLPYDDRIETPEGDQGRVIAGDHPIVAGLSATLPPVLGYHRLSVDDGAEVLIESAKGHPLLVIGAHGSGRSAAWGSDISPHWAPEEFTTWDGYAPLFGQIVTWLAGD